jgi:hypothetical protein
VSGFAVGIDPRSFAGNLSDLERDRLSEACSKIYSHFPTALHLPLDWRQQRLIRVCIFTPASQCWESGAVMPQGKHLQGVSAKEQREYEHIKESAEKSGRYGKRAKEVAARTVMKQHAEKGHKKGQ